MPIACCWAVLGSWSQTSLLYALNDRYDRIYRRERKKLTGLGMGQTTLLTFFSPHSIAISIAIWCNIIRIIFIIIECGTWQCSGVFVTSQLIFLLLCSMLSPTFVCNIDIVHELGTATPLQLPLQSVSFFIDSFFYEGKRFIWKCFLYAFNRSRF